MFIQDREQGGEVGIHYTPGNTPQSLPRQQHGLLSAGAGNNVTDTKASLSLSLSLSPPPPPPAPKCESA